MRYINHVFEIKSNGIINSVDEGIFTKAHDYQVVRQLQEDAISPLLSYKEDPLYLEVLAVQVDFDGKQDILFEDTNYPVIGFYFTWGYKGKEYLYYVAVEDVELVSLHEFFPETL